MIYIDAEELQNNSFFLNMNLQWFAPEDEGKTEDPTEYRLRKEKEEGRVPKSQDLVSAISLLLTSVTLAIVGPWILDNLRQMLTWMLNISTEIDITTEAGPVANAFFSYLPRVVLPIAVVAMVAGIFGNVLQTGPMFTVKALKPDLKKLIPHPGQYLKRTMFSGEALFNLAKSLLKVVIIGFVAYLNIKGEMPKLIRLFSSTIWNSVSYISGIVIRIVLETAVLMLVLSIPDFIFQRIQFKNRLKMTKQEVKEEFKMFEGDPMVKGHIMQKMQEILSQNMAVNVPKADVVITNPTHYAVAVEYNPDAAPVPVVTAKGADEAALRIKKIARDNNVTIVENRPLARALYAEVDVGQMIPENYLVAISEVLAHVTRIDARVAEKMYKKFGRQ